MRTVIELLGEKNQCLEKFYRLNEAEIENFAHGNFDNLESFYSNREGLLEIIRKVDEMIERSNDLSSAKEEVDSAAKRAVQEALDYKTTLVNRILDQDLKILSSIEAAKSVIIKELAQVRATKKALGSYKSGKAVNHLDEEA